MQENNIPKVEVARMTNRDKIILIVLTIIFLGVSFGATWDLYGKKILISYLCNPQNVTLNSTLQATSTTENVREIPVDNRVIPTSGQDNKQIIPNTGVNPTPKTDGTIAYSSYSTCLENTKDGPTAKDCCDCLSADVSVRKTCRDATVSYDFSKNTVFKTFNIPSTLGKNGNYSAFTASGNEQQCKQACESISSGLACGDYQYCRTACNNLPQ